MKAQIVIPRGWRRVTRGRVRSTDRLLAYNNPSDSRIPHRTGCFYGQTGWVCANPEGVNERAIAPSALFHDKTLPYHDGG